MLCLGADYPELSIVCVHVRACGCACACVPECSSLRLQAELKQELLCGAKTKYVCQLLLSSLVRVFHLLRRLSQEFLEQFEDVGFADLSGADARR